MKINFINLYILVIILTLLTFQNLIAIYMSTYSNAKYIIAIKDVMIVSVLIIEIFLFSAITLLTLKIKKPLKLDLFILAFVIYIIVYLVLPIGSSSIFAKFIAVRQLLILPFFYFLGRMFANIDIRYLNNILIVLGLLVAYFGFIEYFFLKDEFWINLNIYEYMKQKGMEQWAYGPGGIPGNFYTYDFINIIGEPIRRNVTLLAEPTLSGHFFSYLVVLTFFTGKMLLFILFFISLIFTLSKGGIFVVILSFLLMGIKKLNVFLRKIVVVIGFIFFVILVYMSYMVSPSVKNHMFGLLYNIYLLTENPLGYGLGTSGNFAKLYSNIIEGAGESFFGSLIGQVGIIGGILYILILKEIINTFFKSKDTYYKVIFATSFSTLIAGFLSESAISFVGSGYIFLLLGLTYGKHQKGEKYGKSFVSI